MCYSDLVFLFLFFMNVLQWFSVFIFIFYECVTVI
jgi:hypothetical protein